ncbi:hypothetical protein Scep_005966 [Stephania cephalantha]|uniref:Uncharacterized protein n=1 Tax=Stephania cephalantha TaxID=152367 RepID=A0AAP0K8P8_9MAGN
MRNPPSLSDRHRHRPRSRLRRLRSAAAMARPRAELPAPASSSSAPPSLSHFSLLFSLLNHATDLATYRRQINVYRDRRRSIIKNRSSATDKSIADLSLTTKRYLQPGALLLVPANPNFTTFVAEDHRRRIVAEDPPPPPSPSSSSSTAIVDVDRD